MSTICIGDEYFDEFWNPDNDDRPDFFDVGGDTFEHSPGRARPARWHDGDDMDLLTSEDSLLHGDSGVSVTELAREWRDKLVSLSAGAVIGLLDSGYNRNGTEIYTIAIMREEDGLSVRNVEAILGRDQNLVWNRHNRYCQKRDEIGLGSMANDGMAVLLAAVSPQHLNPVDCEEYVDNMRIALLNLEAAMFRFWWEQRETRDPMFCWACHIAELPNAPTVLRNRLHKLGKPQAEAARREFCEFQQFVDRGDLKSATELSSELISRAIGGAK